MEFPTDKQSKRVERIIDYMGLEYVRSYIKSFYEHADLNNLTKSQAQKIITGLGHKLPSKALSVNNPSQYF